MIQVIGKSFINEFLDKVETYNSNPRYNRQQFTKYLDSEKIIDQPNNSIWLGNFDNNGNLQALAFCNKQPNINNIEGLSTSFVCICEVQSFNKGYGKPLIQYIVDNSKNLWWAQDWEGGEKLEAYYDQFGLKKTVVYNCSYNGKDVNFFYKTICENDENIFLNDFLKKFEVK